MLFKRMIAGLATSAMIALGAGAASAAMIDFTASNAGTSGALFDGAVTWSMATTGEIESGKAYTTKVNAKLAQTGLALKTNGLTFFGANAPAKVTTNAKVKAKAKAKSVVQSATVTITFSKAVQVTTMKWLDLFRIGYGKRETGYALINGVQYAAVGGKLWTRGAAGYAQVNFDSLFTDKIVFWTGGLNRIVDGSLAAIGVEQVMAPVPPVPAPVPVPAAGGLMALGLGGLAVLRRRKSA